MFYLSQKKKTDSTSEFRGVNDATINALRWKADKPSNFAIKATGNFAHINNGKPKPMLCLDLEKRLLKTEKWLDLALRTGKFFADICESLCRRDIKSTN
ncbi:4086_t:CDS:2 [Cetraspora pellucida]|uniref:4086_t:CDS:1 n=1 Tax=Cetraspora pellucida TaxID=1433469 RepID=A0A9N9JTR8_9GLOM|nr:4086_t:CDS:2 [Cetraspora pellucida]